MRLNPAGWRSFLFLDRTDPAPNDAGTHCDVEVDVLDKSTPQGRPISCHVSSWPRCEDNQIDSRGLIYLQKHINQINDVDKYQTNIKKYIKVYSWLDTTLL